jgi:hypothetical protein
MAPDRDGYRSSATSNSVRDQTLSHADNDSEPESPIDTGSSIKLGLVRRSSILLAEDPFLSDDSKLLFEAIDELRKCGAGQDLDLPQV